MRTSKRNGYLIVSLATVLLGGCGGAGGAGGESGSDGQPAAEADKAPDPVTITVFNPNNYTDELWNTLWVEPIKKKYPHITLINIKNQKGSTLDELILSQNIPDLIQGPGAGYTFNLKDLGLLYDMTPLLAEHKFELGNFNPSVLDSVKTYFNAVEPNRLFGLPITQNNVALYYNKALFDKFGVPYPKDGMTWDDAHELAKRMTRKEDGVQYRGFDMLLSTHLQYNQLSLPFVDSRTDQALANTDGWRTWFDTMKRFYEIEGNNRWNQLNDFLKERTVAMFSAANLTTQLREAEGLEWNMVTMPTFAQAPQTGIQAAGPVLYISSASKHKDEAFAVLAHYVSDEVQIERTRGAEPSVLKNQEINKQFGQERPHLQGKNLASFFGNKIAPSPASVTKYDNVGLTMVTRAFTSVLSGAKDVNTALREADEQINKEIQALKSK